MSLIEHLKTVPDFRTQPRYPLWVILLLVIMGIMSGAQGYRALEDFVARHQTALLQLLELPHKRLPGFSTLRRVMVRLNYVALGKAFNNWAQEAFPMLPGELVPADGKGIKASVSDYDQEYQDFVSVVSAFSVHQGIVVGLEVMRNGETSEIATLQHLLGQLQLTGVCFSMDALHTQKKQLHQSSIAKITI
jgi:DDE_Tnp_1-associated